MAGGFGTRISEESHLKPKPMIEIGGKPILWHIMKGYAAHGFNEFIICCGYKSEIIKQYFLNYFLYHCDITFDFRENNAFKIHNNITDPWQVTVIDTGLHTMTGGRIKQIKPYTNNETFMLTYGDGLSNVDINKLLAYHRKMGKLATVTGINKKTQYGILTVENGIATSFREKESPGGLINGGFFVFEPAVYDYITDDTNCILEQEPLKNLARDGQLAVYYHEGFWTACDTYSDILKINMQCESQQNLWKAW